MIFNNHKAYTLVEMLVALAVSAIIIAATYASYEMVATQYHKNMDIADMHTSGRAIMRIIERDVRMAGFEYRDKDAKITYGSISNPITIKDSGNKCCDEVTVIYDYFDEDTKKAERLRIRYWAEPHTSNKGSRHRLYKQKDILGQNKKILAKPILGTKEVMADYIEDLQLVNIENSKLLYAASADYEIAVIDPIQKKGISVIKSGLNYRPNSGLAFGPDGLLYAGSSNYAIMIIDPEQEKGIGAIRSGLNYRPSGGLAFGPDGLLYVCTNSYSVMIVDPIQKKGVGAISSGLSYRANSDLAFGPNGLLYAGTSSDKIMIIDPIQKKQVGVIDSGINHRTSGGLAFGPNGLLYAGTSSDKIMIIDPSQNKGVGTIGSGLSYRPNYYLEFGSDGLIYAGTSSDKIMIVDPIQKKQVGVIDSGINHRTYGGIAFKDKRTGQESLVTINLTLRTKNQYGKDRQFKKKDYHGGNFKIDKTDKYKRDTFSSTVLVRNLAL